MTVCNIQQRFETALIIGAAGGAVALALTGADRSLVAGWGQDWGFVRLACAGAFVSGLLVADAFGHRGWRGALAAGVGFVVATVIGAMAAFCLMPIEGWLTGVTPFPGNLGPLHVADALLAPVFVLGSVLGSVPLAVVWAGSAWSVHEVARGLRKRGAQGQARGVNP